MQKAAPRAAFFVPASNRGLLDRLATDRMKLIGFHLPWPGVGYVERKDRAYRFVAA